MYRFIFSIPGALVACMLFASSALACDIPAEIAAVQDEVSARPLRIGTKDYRYTEVRAGTKKTISDPEREIALVLLNLESCQTRTVQIIKRGDQLIAPSGYHIEPVRRVNGIRWNDWATDYRVNEPSGWVVVANAFPHVISGSGKKRIVENVFYISYTPELHRPEFVRAGQDHLLALARQALQELRSDRVSSLAMPEILLADTPASRPEWLARLAPMEHTDMTEFVLDPDWTIERAFIRIGLNGDRFGTYTCSKAAACGLMQFTKGSYDLLRKAYPTAHLDPDFTRGARNQLNAMKAAYLHHDDILRQLIEVFGPSITNDRVVLEELEDGGYNGGSKYIIQAYKQSLKKKSIDWISTLPACKGKSRNGCMPRETKEYVAVKLRYLRDHYTGPTVARADQSPD